MDTQEDIEIQQALKKGHPVVDEGHYYHESWWESYKGNIKGKLGGAVIGALVGAVLGTIAAVIAVAAGIPSVAGIAIIGAFASGGMVYGAEEFGMVGTVTGAVAAAHENAEVRMKSFETGKFTEINNQISDLKRMVARKSGEEEKALTPSKDSAAAPQTLVSSDDAHKEPPARHYIESNIPVKERKPIFWKIAMIGLAIGAAAGALLAFGGGAGEIAAALALITGVAEEAISQTAILAASVTTLGLFGASFGINRDFFRKIFDKTDHIYKGVIDKGPVHSPTIAEPGLYAHFPAPRLHDGRPHEGKMGLQPSKINTVVYDEAPDYTRSDTFHRDRVLASARQALLSMDHTKSVPH